MRKLAIKSKKCLSVLMSVLMLISVLAVGLSASALDVTVASVSDITSGDTYVLAMDGLVPVNMSSNTYVMKNTLPANTPNLLDFQLFDANGIDETMLWTITAEGSGYVVTPYGSTQYLNVSASGVSLSATKQVLTFTKVNNTFRISDGTNYIRFTNSATVGGVSSQSAFTAANRTTSSEFSLYKATITQPQQPDDPPVQVEVSYVQVGDLLGGLKNGGTYLFAMFNITDALGVSGPFTLMNTLPSDTPNFLGYEPFNAVADPSSVTDADLWILGIEEGGYTLSPVDRPTMYLNVSSSALSITSTKQLLTFTASGSTVTITANSRLVRFTNSATIGGVSSRSAFTQGTNTASSTFNVYEQIKTETPVIDEPDEPGEPEGEPFFTLAAMSDLHVDYGIQTWDPPIRPGTITTLSYIKEQSPNALAFLGDTTSNNAGRTWTAAQHQNVMNTIKTYATDAVSLDRILFVTGNHDFVAGGTSYNSGDYRAYMRGDLQDVLYQGSTPEHMLCYHTIIDGVDFIGVNTPYEGGDKHNDYYYYENQMSWLNAKLDEIGVEKTVIVLGHYPLNDSKNITDPSKGMSNTYNTNTLFKAALTRHPNAIYLYGHDHGGWQIKTDTFERVTTYDANGNPVYTKTSEPTGFVTSFVGSMGYYEGSLTAQDVESIQNLMVYMYADRIVFQMVNHAGAAEGGTEEIASYTIMRDLSAYIPEEGTERLNDNYENRTVNFTFETPINATGITLTNEAGKKLGIISRSYEVQDGKLVWTVSTSFGTAGVDREIHVSYRTTTGQTVDLNTVFVVTIKPEAAFVLSADFLDDETIINTPTQLRVVTSSNVKKIHIYNSSDRKIGFTTVSKESVDGNLVWTVEFSIGTAGRNREFTAVATDFYGNVSDNTQSAKIDVALFAA